MNINKSAPAVASHEIVINAPIDKVWTLVADVEAWPNWNPAVKSAKLNGEFKLATTFNWKSGGISIVSTFQEIEVNAKLVWTGKAIGTQAIHAWTFASTPSGVLVSTAESFEGWLVKLMPKAMQKTLDESLTAWLEEMKRKAEG